MEGGFQNNKGGGETEKGHEDHEEVRGGEEGPGLGGFHLCFVTEAIIALFLRKAKVGKPTHEVGYAVRVNEFGCCGGGISPTLLFAVFQTLLLKIEAFANGGIVKADD